jgi:membrane-associated phospholipid phosphatase
LETIAFLQQFASPTLDRLMLVITDLGDVDAYIALLVIIYLAINADLGRRVGIVLTLSLLLNSHLKGLVDTPRPFDLDPEAARSDEAVATAPGAGFPSGHAQGSASFWGYLALQVRRRWLWVVAIVVVALISISRIYLGVHVPIDIIGGLAIAAGILLVAYLVERYVPRLARPWPRPVLFLLGLLVPLGLHLVHPVTNSAVLMGGLAAFLTAGMLIRHQPPRQLGRKVAVAAIGLVLVFAVLLGSSVLLPEAVKADPPAGFVRYLALGYVGLALTPYLARVTGLAAKPDSGGPAAVRAGRST